MRIKSISADAIVRRASSDVVLRVGDDVSAGEAIRVECAPKWPETAVTFESDEEERNKMLQGLIDRTVIE